MKRIATTDVSSTLRVSTVYVADAARYETAIIFGDEVLDYMEHERSEGAARFRHDMMVSACHAWVHGTLRDMVRHSASAERIQDALDAEVRRMGGPMVAARVHV